MWRWTAFKVRDYIRSPIPSQHNRLVTVAAAADQPTYRPTNIWPAPLNTSLHFNPVFSNDNLTRQT